MVRLHEVVDRYYSPVVRKRSTRRVPISSVESRPIAGLYLKDVQFTTNAMREVHGVFPEIPGTLRCPMDVLHLTEIYLMMVRRRDDTKRGLS